MNKVIEQIGFLFRDHYLELLIFSLTWVFVSALFLTGNLLARKVFFRFPMSVWIWSQRRMISKERQKLRVGSKSYDNWLDSSVLELNTERLYRKIEEQLKDIYRGKYLISRLLTPTVLSKELRLIEITDWKEVEADYAFCSALSADVDRRTRGLISFLGNPIIKRNEALNLLFFTLDKNRYELPADSSEFALVLYHIKRQVANIDELNQFERLVPRLPEEEKELLKEAAEEIRQNIAVAAHG